MVKVPVTIQKIAKMMLNGDWSADDWEGFLNALAIDEVPKLSDYRKLKKETDGGG